MATWDAELPGDVGMPDIEGGGVVPASAPRYFTLPRSTDGCRICTFLVEYPDVKQRLNEGITMLICGLTTSDEAVNIEATEWCRDTLQTRRAPVAAITEDAMEHHIVNCMCTPEIMAARAFRLCEGLLRDSVRHAATVDGAPSKDGMDNIVKANKMLHMWYDRATDASKAVATKSLDSMPGGRVSTVPYH